MSRITNVLVKGGVVEISQPLDTRALPNLAKNHKSGTAWGIVHRR